MSPCGSLVAPGSVTIGQAVVTPQHVTNPYRYRGVFSMGHWRKLALKEFRDGGETFGLQLWYTPAEGGAQKITADQVDWRGMGS